MPTRCTFRTAQGNAAFADVREATVRIDLTKHLGELSLLGATDMVPFVPLDGVTKDDCVAVARELGEHVARELPIPVHLDERAVHTPARENLVDVRRDNRAITATGDVRVPDFGDCAEHPTAGSDALDLCDVACGRFQGFWELELAPWDVAAGILIVREAGGRVTDFDGRDVGVVHGPIVASNGVMHAWWLGVLAVRP